MDSWQSWSDFLNSNDDTYSFENSVKEDAEKYKKGHKEMANLIEQVIDNPELIKQIEELNKDDN